MASSWEARGAAALTAAVLLGLVLLSLNRADANDHSDGHDVTIRHLSLDRRKRDVTFSPVSITENEIRPKRRKGRRRKKFKNGTVEFRKRKKGQRRKWNRTSVGVLMPKSDPDILGNAIIRTSEDDGPQHRLLIQTVRGSNSSSVRYFPNYPTHAAQWREHRGPTRHLPRPVPSATYPPRYSDTYLNWHGLRYGCACHPTGSESAACDIVTGQCPCRENVTGRACDQCELNHWGLSSNKGCRPCDCDSKGSLGQACDVFTGQCVCRPGVGSTRCDSCLPQFFGFSEEGCKACDTCTESGHICDDISGRCICPARTHGPLCQSCVPNSWGFRPNLGCLPCDCDAGGSVRGQCDFTSGECECRTGFAGRNCSQCAEGFYGFPMCKPCQCDTKGSLGVACDDDGTCSCKINVQGPKCNTCRPGTFGLESDNPNGCTACFCFGRSASCTQAGLSWSQVRSSRPRSVSIEYDPSPPFQNTLPIDTQEICYINLAIPGGGEVTLNGADRGLNVTNNLRTIPGDTEDVKIGVSFLFDTPVYWQLPQQFLGDKVLSYGGFLKFVVETEGGHTHLPSGVLATYPLIQLQGNNKVVLEYFPILPSPNGRYDVRFHESLWFEKNPKKQASRETLMVALQNVQHILIRASDAVDFTRVVLKDVSMDTAAVSAGSGLALAGGVERCQCPPQYNSSSCQDPSIGFFRWFNRTYSTATILISLVGEAKPCDCNGRSSVCNVETGFCSDCSNNTGGPHCERCADGYFGDTATGLCVACPCPSSDRNFATGCQLTPGREPVCFCREGYTSKKCDRCGYGWFGHPEQPGGFCQPCQCHPFGSVSDECHEQTGQCNCRPGILGLDCAICPLNTVLTAKGCSTCEDGCTGILLQDLKAMNRSLHLRAARINDRSEVPWWRLQDFVAGPITTTERLLEQWQSATRDMYHLIDQNNHNRLKDDAQKLHNQAMKLSHDSNEISTVAAILKSQADVMLDQLGEVTDNVNQVLTTLEHYSGDSRIVSDSAALMEARRLLEKISSRYLEPRREQAERTLDLCTSVLLKTRYIQGMYPGLTDVLHRLAFFITKLNDLQNLIQNTLIESEKRSIQTGELRRKLRGVKEKLERVSLDLAEVEQLHSESDALLDEADDALIFADRSYNNLTNIKLSLKNSSLILERKEGILYGLNPLYRSKYVKPAQDHAQILRRLVQDYQKLFNSSLGDASEAVEASRAYQAIVATVENVREAAESATVSADIAMKEVFPLSNDDSVVEKAQISKAMSSRLLTRAQAPQSNGNDLRAVLKEQKEVVDVLAATVREAAVKDNAVSRELNKLENLRVGNQVEKSIAQVDSLESQLGEAKETAQKLVESVNNKLQPQLTVLTAEAKQLDLTKVRDDIEESLKANQRATELLQQLTAELDIRKQRHSFRLANETLSSVLVNLRNKIVEARHAAHGVRLSLSSNSTKGCVRSYKVAGLEPTIANRIVLTLSLNARERNGIILYLPSSTSSDFLAVELANGKVRFVWDLGGGASFVEKSLMNDLKSQRGGSQWFKIVVERTSYTARLWVLPGSFSENQVNSAKNSSNPEYGWLDLSSTDRLWVGGLPEYQEAPVGLLSTHRGLVGCLHSIVLDDSPVGLWNSHMDHTDSCSACVKGVEEAVDESVYRFNGEGYSVLQHVSKSTYNKYQFSVALKFKTYDDNAVLFLAVTNHKDRYVSIHLRDGNVVFQIGYGGESQLEMSSTKKYNDGKWTSVEASRSFDRRRGIEKGLLKVGDEAKEAAPPTPPPQSQIPEMLGADYLIGGVPLGYNFGQLHLRLPKSLLGCMSDLYIDKELYNPLRGRSNGVSSSCSDKIIKVAGFYGDGYLRLKASSLKRKSTFSLVQRTLQADALVLLAKAKESDSESDDGHSNVIEEEASTEAGPRRESYYSVALVDGRVEVRLEAGRGAITLVSQALVNDGRFHAIAVTKTGRKLELRVDDELQASSTLPEGATVVRVDDLFLGGVPKGIEASRYVSDVTPFTGTIKDVLFDDMVQNLETPNGFSGVELGRLGPERDDLAIVPSLMRTSTPHPGCRRSRKYVVDPRAVKFGDSPNSHIQIHVRRRNLFVRNFTLELDFRTFYSDGLLFLVPGAHKGVVKFKHFLLGGLRNGQVNIIVKGKKKLDLMSSQKVNDGSWHHILFSKEDRNISLSVDSGEPAYLPIKLPKRINAGNILYIGGLPEKGAVLPDSLLSRVEGFRGCVRNLKLSNQTEDLIGDKSQHQRVGQCFPQVEKGSYFSGDAYVVHRKNFLIEDLLKFELDFRTSEVNGILLSIAHSRGYPAFSLEFAAGKVILSGDTGDRRIFHLTYDFLSQYAICDNKWHHIEVSYEAEEVVMLVDEQTTRQSLPRNSYFLKSYLDAPLYIGGLPDHVPGGGPLLTIGDNFKGCMRNLVIAGERKDWTSMHALHNVLVGSCPAVTQH